MKGGYWMESPKRDGIAHLFWLAGLILITISLSTASAWSFPFTIPFLASPEGGCQISLDLDAASIGYGTSANYTIHIKNSGREALTDISVSDNFGQAGFIARLPGGGSLDLARTTPPLMASTQLRVVATSNGEEVGAAETAVQVGHPPEEPAAEGAIRTLSGRGDDQILRTLAASPQMELAVAADPATVRPGDGATVRMTVTNRGPKPLRAVEISGPGWTVEAGDLNPGESKTFSRTVTVAEDLSIEIVAAGTTDDGETTTAQEGLTIAATSPDLSVTIVAVPGPSGEAAAIVYRLKNEGEEVLSRVTLKDGGGATLGILPQLAPGETKNLSQTGYHGGEERGPFEVTALSPEGRTVTGEVTVQSSGVQGPGTGSGTSKTASKPIVSMELGALPSFDMGLDLKLQDPASSFGTPSDASGERGSGSSAPASIAPSIGPGFGDFSFNFEDFGLLDPPRPSAADGASGSEAAETRVETEGDKTGDAGSPNLAVTLQANRTLVHRGDAIAYRCAAVNRGTGLLTDVKLRCGGEEALAEKLAPGDGLPLNGVMRVEGPLALTASATAAGPDGSIISEEAALEIGAVSPDLRVEVRLEPDRISRGQRGSITVRLENGGDDALTDLVVDDDLGEIGRVPVLGPGKVVTLSRNSTIYSGLEDEVWVAAIDSTGSPVLRSEILEIVLSEPGLSLEVEPEEAAAYPGETVEVVWTIRNTGEVDLVDVTMVVDGDSRFRLPAIASGGSTQISSSHQPDESRRFLARAEGKTAGGETVSSEAAFDVRVVSPGISLNVKPTEVEACQKKPFNLTFLVTNTGDDVLRDVTVSERSLGTLEKIGRLEPGDFKVASHDFFTETNTTFRLQATGIDSRGNGVNDTQEVAVKLASANIELSVRADPAETAPDGSVAIVFAVENRGEVPIFSTFIMGGSLGHLGTIDYISPGSSRSLETVLEVSEELEEEIVAEGFTKDGSPVRDTEILSVGLALPTPQAEKARPPETSGAVPAATVEATEVYAPEAGDQEGLGPGEGNDTGAAISAFVGEEDGSGVNGLLNRLMGILEKIRLTKESPEGASAEGYAPGTAPAGSEAPKSSGAPPSSSLPGSSTAWSGYGTHEEKTTGPAAPGGALPEGAGYAPSDLGRASGNLSPLGPRPEPVGYSYSADGPASSYLSSPEMVPGAAGGAYSASGPASEYLSTPWTAAGTAEYATSKSGPFSALTSAGGSPTIAGSSAPAGYENVDLRSASEASPAVAEARSSAGYSSRHIRSEVSPGYAEASAPAERLSLDIQSTSKTPSEGGKLMIGDTTNLQVDRPPRIIDVGAFPPEPPAWTPVVLTVHASDDIGIKSANLLWATPTTSISRLDLVDATKINTQKMALEEGDLHEGYWSYEIPGQPAGTYMAVFVKVSDGERWAEDGPYIIFWSAEASPEAEAPPATASPPEVEVAGRGAVGETRKGGMLFVESTTVVGRGDVSIKNEIREDNARYKEELDGKGSIEMQSEKTINKGNPVVNITDSRLLVFDQGYLKGFKIMQSPSFHGGMGASVTERFNATTLEKSETGTISSYNRSEHALLFNSQQAFEGIWGTRTEYSNFNKKIKADQTLTGTFETQKRITFKD